MQAQYASLDQVNSLIIPPTIPGRTGGYLNEWNTKALLHFKRSFADAENERWSVGPDCYRVKFTRNSIQYFVDYSKKGNWRNTIRIYDESHLPPDLRRLVKTTFFDHSILTVTELHYQKTLAYFIKIQYKGSTKTVRVIGQEMEVVEEFYER